MKYIRKSIWETNIKIIQEFGVSDAVKEKLHLKALNRPKNKINKQTKNKMIAIEERD